MRLAHPDIVEGVRQVCDGPRVVVAYTVWACAMGGDRRRMFPAVGTRSQRDMLFSLSTFETDPER